MYLNNAGQQRLTIHMTIKINQLGRDPALLQIGARLGLAPQLLGEELRRRLECRFEIRG